MSYQDNNRLFYSDPEYVSVTASTEANDLRLNYWQGILYVVQLLSLICYKY